MTAVPAISAAAPRRTLLVLLAALAVALGAAGHADAARDPAQPVLREAGALAAHWGRCPTSRPAHVALRRAVDARPSARPARARVALRAWRTVVRECSAPVAMPTADPAA